jgi:hypothetical protein
MVKKLADKVIKFNRELVTRPKVKARKLPTLDLVQIHERKLCDTHLGCTKTGNSHFIGITWLETPESQPKEKLYFNRNEK